MNKKSRNQLAVMMGQRRRRKPSGDIPVVSPDSWTDQAVAMYPELKAEIEAWPNIVNSLLETGKRNYLIGDGVAYVLTGIYFGDSVMNGFLFEVEAAHPYKKYNWNVHGAFDRYACCVGMSPSKLFCCSDGVNVEEYGDASNYIDKDLRYVLDYANNTFKVYDGDNIVTDESFRPQKPSRSGQLNLFRWGPNGVAFPARLHHATIIVNSIEHRLVPYQKNNVPGLLDLFDGSFHGNANSRGTFSLMTV